MARYSEHDTTAIYELAARWKEDCLLRGGSLLWPEEAIWAADNLAAFKTCFIDRPDESSDSFEEKFQRQLSSEAAEVTKLACELVLIYFLFPSSVTGNRKRELIETIASWQSVAIPESGKASLAILDHGIGGPGLAYNTRRPFEVAFLAELAIALHDKEESERKEHLNDHTALRQLLDDLEGDNSRQGRDIVLHLLYPDKYERMASRGHKRRIAETFNEMLGGKDVPEDLDDRILSIRQNLEELLPGKELDFYWSPLRECWYVRGEADELNPVDGLAIKRQIVYFGPPGTGKTYEARETADRFVRKGLLSAWGPKRYFESSDDVAGLVKKRVRRVQFHPGYSYEDLIRGLQLVDGGRTEYRDGILLQILDSLKQDGDDLRDVPFVLILDEMNRADLSRVLGECFSLLEDRDMPVQLAGQDDTPREVTIPPNLYFIGTMNLIDQSLEQVDFALRRRFLWFPRWFDASSGLVLTDPGYPT